MTPDLARRLAEHKTELVVMLTAEAPDRRSPDDPDGWPNDCIDPPDPCPDCGSLELWQTRAGNWRCLRCDPPIRSRELAREAREARRKAKQRIPP